MQVLHVTPYLSPAWAFGPVPQRVFELARAQVASGLRVAVLTTDAMAPHERLRPGTSTVDGVQIVRVRSITGALRSWLNLSTPIGVRRRAAALTLSLQPEVIHLHNVHTVENLRVSGAVPCTTALVLSPHDSLRAGGTPAWVRRAWYRCGGDALLARVDILVVAADSDVGAVHELYETRGIALPPDRVATVRNGIELPDVSALSATAARQRFNLRDGPVVLFVGRLTPESGAALLVDAFGQLQRSVPSAQLLVVGADHGGQNLLEAGIGARGLAPSVRLAGHLTGLDYSLAFAASDLLAVPGRAEGYPTAPLLALASGLPLVGECGLPEAVEAGVGRLPVPDAHGWALALEQTWREVSERPAMREAARAVAEGFSWRASAAALQRVYQRALRNAG